MRLIPGLIGGSPTKKKTPEAWAAMQQLGFIDGNGNSTFFNKKGGIVDANKMLSTMISDSKKFNPMQLTGLYKKIFGTIGGRAAGILANPRSIEQFQRMQKQLGHSKSINQRVDQYQKTASGQLNLMKSNSMSIMLSVAQQLAIALNPVLTKMNALLTSTLKFSIAHPTFAKIIADLALLAVGGKLFEGSLKLGFGALKMLDGGFGMLKVASKAKELTNLGKIVMSLKGPFMAVKDGIMLFGSTTLTILKGFGKGLIDLAAKAATFAIEMASSWLTAMGPVSWIIAGVTAVIAAGIIAWKTNFFGFRDGLTAVWRAIQSAAATSWNGIKSVVMGVINWFKSLPSEMLTIGKQIMQGLINGVTSMVGAVGNAISGVAKGISGAFKSMLGIHSPSRVFMEHGKFIVQGLALGIDGNKQIANRSTTNLANGIVGAFRPNVQSPMSTNNSSGAINNFHSGAIVINGGNASADQIADEVMKRLGKATRRGGMNTGTTVNMGAF